MTQEIYDKYLKLNTKASYFTYCSMKGTNVILSDNYAHDPITVLYRLNRSTLE